MFAIRNSLNSRENLLKKCTKQREKEKGKKITYDAKANNERNTSETKKVKSEQNVKGKLYLILLN